MGCLPERAWHACLVMKQQGILGVRVCVVWWRIRPCVTRVDCKKRIQVPCGGQVRAVVEAGCNPELLVRLGQWLKQAATQPSSSGFCRFNSIESEQVQFSNTR
jgi:hypothetical protein